MLGLLALTGCEKRTRTKNSSGSSGLFEEGATATTNVYRFVGVEQSLGDARKAVTEERWEEALAATDALLKQQAGNVEAKQINAQARLELPNLVRWNDFQKAAKANEVGAAVKQYRLISEESMYRDRARATYDKLSTTFVDNQIADSRALNRAGRCDEARRVARVTGEWFPDAKGRLDDAVTGCRPVRAAAGSEPVTEVVVKEEKLSPPIAMAPLPTARDPVPTSAEPAKNSGGEANGKAQPSESRTLAATVAPGSGSLSARVAPAPPPPAPPAAAPVAAAPPAHNVPISELEALRIAGDRTPALPAGAKMIAIRDGIKRITVAVKLCVSDAGVPTNVSFVKSSDYGDANEKIVADIRKWRFRPFVSNGAPIAVCTASLLNYQIL